MVSTSRPARRVRFQCSLTRKVLQSLSSRDTFAPQIHLFKPKPTSAFLQTFPQLPKGSSNPPSPEVLTALVTTSLYRMYPNPATVYSTLVKKKKKNNNNNFPEWKQLYYITPSLTTQRVAALAHLTLTYLRFGPYFCLLHLQPKQPTLLKGVWFSAAADVFLISLLHG